MAGRKCKLTDERRVSILKDLADGQTRACAAERAGICDRTVRRWLSKGKRGEAEYMSFESAVKKAERDAEALAVRCIRKAGRKNWCAWAWWLERRWPESWGKDAEVIREMVADYKKQKAEARKQKADG